jgi:hypothetical protein
MTDARHDHRPAGTYVLLTAAFNAGALALGALLGSRRRMRIADLLVLGAATHEISRIVTTERVTRSLRRPFVETSEDGHEEPVAEGPRRALGELLTCPYCVGPWIALGLSTSYMLAPAMTRTYATVLTMAAVSNFLHRASALVNAKRSELGARPERPVDARA